jgi:hypothetical protein
MINDDECEIIANAGVGCTVESEETQRDCSGPGFYLFALFVA